MDRHLGNRLIASLGRRREVAIPVALLLVAGIGAADYLTGFEVRLAILYLIPVAVATWACGRGWGLGVAALGPLTWAGSFASQHVYSRDLYFYWECAVMAATLLLFVELLVRLKAALERSDERFVRVLDGLYAAVYVTDDSDAILFANRRFAQLIGGGAVATSAAAIGARFAPAVVEAPGTAAAPSDMPFAGTEVRDLKDGRWYLVQAGHIPWVDRRRVALKVITDITDQKLAQALQREHQDALHHTSRLVSLAEAATTLAHELNQPLVAIVGYNAACIRLLESGAEDRSELRAAMEKCRAQALRAGDIIARLRELTRRRAPHLAPCDLNAVIRQTLAWVEEELARAHIDIDLALSASLPRVPADRILIEQLMLNLEQNAIDSMRHAKPGRRTLRIESSTVDGAAKVTVSDQGEGLAPAAVERLFTPFFTTKDDGLGLGLSICRSAVELHGGRIWYAPNDGSGASFQFTLPCNGS